MKLMGHKEHSKAFPQLLIHSIHSNFSIQCNRLVRIKYFNCQKSLFYHEHYREAKHRFYKFDRPESP